MEDATHIAANQANIISHKRDRAEGGLRRTLIRAALRGMLAFHAAFSAAGLLWRRLVGFRRFGDRATILLTGTFHSTNWIAAHLIPLSRSARCERVILVTTFAVPAYDKVTTIAPPRWLCRLVGSVPARLITFACAAITNRPHFVGGFHLLLNGLVAAAVGPWVRARAMNFCVSGPAEVLDGGIWAENRLFARIERPDPSIERQLIRAVRRFDLVIAMGTRAPRFFRERGADTRFEVISGGIDAARITPTPEPPAYDIILVGRLAQIKRIDVFLEALALIRNRRPTTNAVIVGDGELRDALRTLAEALGLGDAVTFAGQQSDVAAWLRRARVFALTSDTEGLALSLIEAMLCGLPAVVSDVGDLRDVVSDDQNGYLVPRRSPPALADRIIDLLDDAEKRERFSIAARQAALQFDTAVTARKWDSVLGSFARER